MRKPTSKQFWLGYFTIWALAQIYVASVLQPTRILLAFSAVNMIVVIINMIGVGFAANGIAPWRDDDQTPASEPPKAYRTHYRVPDEPRIEADSSTWTGR